MTINIREYTRNIYKYLLPGEYVVTKGKKEAYKIVVTCLNVVTKDDVQVIKTSEEARSVVTKLKECVSEYRCGCNRVEGEVLCRKHGRY